MTVKMTLSEKLKKSQADVARLTTLGESKSKSIGVLEGKIKELNEQINELTLQLTGVQDKMNTGQQVVDALEELEKTIQNNFNKSLEKELDEAIKSNKPKEFTQNNLMLYGAKEGLRNAIITAKTQLG